MPVFVSNLTKYGERNLSLITIDGVKDLTARGVSFQCNYDLAGFTEDGKPQYRCIYMPSDDPNWFVLVATRVGKHGPDVRLFNIWPGLFKHHHEFGDGRSLCFNGKFGLNLVEEEI